MLHMKKLISYIMSNFAFVKTQAGGLETSH